MHIKILLSLLPLLPLYVSADGNAIPEIARSHGSRSPLHAAHGHQARSWNSRSNQSRMVKKSATDEVPRSNDKHKGPHNQPAPASSSAKSSPATLVAVSQTTTSSIATASPSTASSTSSWSLTKDYSGSSFFDGWDFWDLADPTGGTVSFVSQADAQSLGLISADSNSAIMRVSTAQPIPAGYSNRPSVRITTELAFTGGLLIGDIGHMPTGCGTWPAFWANGPNWPAGGEVDIIEGVNDASQNTASIHTNPGCTIPTNYGASGKLGLTGSEGYNCAAAETNDAGCGMTDNTPNNFGAPFNSNGGGVYAMKWDSSGLAVWFWPRQSIPSDISSGSPNPNSWGTPEGAWPATDCNPYTYFSQITTIFDTTLCGSWAGNVWSQTVAGSSQSCAASTGYSTCEAFVAAEGGKFSEAYWEVYSVKLYQQAGMTTSS